MKHPRMRSISSRSLALFALVVVLFSASFANAQTQQQDDRQLRNEIQLRTSLYLPNDPAYVRSVHAAKDAVHIDRIGGIFTPTEAKDVLERLDIEQDGATLYRFFATSTERAAAFGGLYVDHMRGGQLVLQLVRTHPQVPSILSTLPQLRYPQRLRVAFVDWPYRHLEHQFNNVSEVVDQYPSLLAVGIEMPTNRVVVTIKQGISNDITDDVVDKGALPPDLEALLSDPTIVVRQGAIVNVPTALMAGNGWNKTGSGGNSCTLGFEVVQGGNPSMLTAGHCVEGMVTGNNTYNFSTQFGIYSGLTTNGCFSNTGNCIDIALLRMNSAATATDDFFRGGGQSTLDVTGPVEQYSYAIGYVRCFYGITSGLLCGTITQASYTFQASFNGRWYRDMFLTDPAPAGGDSGAPVYRTDNATSASAAGILGGVIARSGVTNSNDAYHTKWYNAQSFFNLTLVTTD